MKSESQIQIAAVAAVDLMFSHRWPSLCIRYADGHMIAPLYSVHNEGRRSQRNGARMRAQGLRSGVFLAVVVEGFGGLYVEMKKPGGTTSANQKIWIQRLMSSGYAVAVCSSVGETIAAIDQYMTIKL